MSRIGLSSHLLHASVSTTRRSNSVIQTNSNRERPTGLEQKWRRTLRHAVTYGQFPANHDNILREVRTKMRPPRPNSPEKIKAAPEREVHFDRWKLGCLSRSSYRIGCDLRRRVTRLTTDTASGAKPKRCERCRRVACSGASSQVRESLSLNWQPALQDLRVGGDAVPPESGGR
jgi:hypothetical protein